MGEDEALLRNMVIEKGLSDTIRFRGFCASPRDEMLEADALIFPSLYEGMPNVLVEALASGLPVIASDIFASRDIIDNNDCVNWFDLQDPSSLSQCIMDYMSGPDIMYCRRDRGLALIERFSPSKLARNYKDIYRTLI